MTFHSKYAEYPSHFIYRQISGLISVYILGIVISMRAVIQRVSYGAVEGLREIGKGLVILVGVGKEDRESDASSLADKIVNLRIFEDQEGKFNLSSLEVNAELLVISQFTLYGDVKKGRRPDFSQAAKPEEAKALYNKFIELLSQYGLKVVTGEFAAKMKVIIHNEGPVTILIDSKKEI